MVGIKYNMNIRDMEPLIEGCLETWSCEMRFSFLEAGITHYLNDNNAPEGVWQEKSTRRVEDHKLMYHWDFGKTHCTWSCSGTGWGNYHCRSLVTTEEAGTTRQHLFQTECHACCSTHQVLPQHSNHWQTKWAQKISLQACMKVDRLLLRTSGLLCWCSTHSRAQTTTLFVDIWLLNLKCENCPKSKRSIWLHFFCWLWTQIKDQWAGTCCHIPERLHIKEQGQVHKSKMQVAKGPCNQGLLVWGWCLCPQGSQVVERETGQDNVQDGQRYQSKHWWRGKRFNQDCKFFSRAWDTSG